jgi:20S proteasome subunit alpha 4
MTRDETIKLAVKSLLEVVQTGAKNIEISVMESYGKITVSLQKLFLPCARQPNNLPPIQNLELSQIEAIVADIEKEKEAGSYLSAFLFEASKL